MTIPAEIGDTLWTDYDWKLQTVQQEYLDNRNVVFNQGRVVGGGTILNGMVWTRGSARDYDAWGDLNAVKGQTNGYNWRWKDLLPYFQKVRLGIMGFSWGFADACGDDRARTSLRTLMSRSNQNSIYIPTRNIMEKMDLCLLPSLSSFTTSLVSSLYSLMLSCGCL